MSTGTEFERSVFMARYVPRIKLFSLISLCLLGSTGQTLLAAQTERPETPLTLHEAIKIGLANNPKIMAVKSQVNVSEARGNLGESWGRC